MASLLSACASATEHDPVYHADLSFTSDERVEILRAADRLATISGQPIDIVFDGRTDTERTITRFPAGIGACNEITGLSQHIRVGLDATGARPLLSTAAEDVGTIVAHELGHGLGMNHVEDAQA